MSLPSNISRSHQPHINKEEKSEEDRATEEVTEDDSDRPEKEAESQADGQVSPGTFFDQLYTVANQDDHAGAAQPPPLYTKEEQRKIREGFDVNV